jgi:hypothetical protein
MHRVLATAGLPVEGRDAPVLLVDCTWTHEQLLEICKGHGGGINVYRVDPTSGDSY